MCQSIIWLAQSGSLGLTILGASGLVMSHLSEHVLIDMKTFAFRSGGQRRSLDSFLFLRHRDPEREKYLDNGTWLPSVPALPVKKELIATGNSGRLWAKQC